MNMSPTYTELLNSKWDEKWGYIWNPDYIERTKSEMVAYIQFHLATQKYYPVSVDDLSFSDQLSGFSRATIGRPLSWVLTRKFSIWMLFWVPIFLRLRRLRPTERIQQL